MLTDIYDILCLQAWAMTCILVAVVLVLVRLGRINRDTETLASDKRKRKIGFDAIADDIESEELAPNEWPE